MNGKWLELDELENAIDNLEMASYFLEQITSEKKWKWAIIATHQALYGFAICSIKGTSTQHLIDPNSKKGEEKLIGIWEALRRAQDTQYLPWAHCIPLTISQEEDWAIQKIINEFRNGFEHFMPKIWAIETSGMPQILHQVFHVIGFLALESNCITYFETDQKIRIENALTQIQNSLDAKSQSET